MDNVASFAQKNDMNIANISELLAGALVDNATGVKLVPVTGDKDISVFAAEIASHTALNAHYHKAGIEVYQILSGSGIMKIGNSENGSGNWEEELEVNAGDCFTVSSPQMHQIINNTDDLLTTLFICPADHIGNDRYFVEM